MLDICQLSLNAPYDVAVRCLQPCPLQDRPALQTGTFISFGMLQTWELPLQAWQLRGSW